MGGLCTSENGLDFYHDICLTNCFPSMILMRRKYLLNGTLGYHISVWSLLRTIP